MDISTLLQGKDAQALADIGQQVREQVEKLGEERRARINKAFKDVNSLFRVDPWDGLILLESDKDTEGKEIDLAEPRRLYRAMSILHAAGLA